MLSLQWPRGSSLIDRSAASSDDNVIAHLADWGEGEPAVLLLPHEGDSSMPDLEISVEVRALFGPFQRVVRSERLPLRSLEPRSIPISLQGVADIHSAQADYLTQIECTVAILVDGRTSSVQRLNTRFLAIEEDTGSLLLLDESGKRERFPYGITSTAVLQRVESIRNLPTEGASLGFAPDVMIEEPIGTRIRPSDD